MSAPSERGVSGKVSDLDHEPTAGELGIADGPSDEYRSGPPEPPADLPATLSSVDDLVAVCRAVGLVEVVIVGHSDQRRWRDPEGLSDVEVGAFPTGWSLTYARPPAGAPVGPFRVEAPWELDAPVGPLLAALRAAW